MLPTVASTQRGQSPSGALESSAAPHCSHVRKSFMPIDLTLLPRPFHKQTGRKVTLKTVRSLTARRSADAGASPPSSMLLLSSANPPPIWRTETDGFSPVIKFPESLDFIP